MKRTERREERGKRGDFARGRFFIIAYTCHLSEFDLRFLFISLLNFRGGSARERDFLQNSEYIYMILSILLF